MDHRDHVVVRHRGRGNLDVGNHVRPLAGLVACLGHLHLVADPGHVALLAVAGLGVIGRADLLGRGRQFGPVAQAHPPIVRHVLRRPDLAQALHRRQLCQFRPLRGDADRAQQVAGRWRRSWRPGHGAPPRSWAGGSSPPAGHTAHTRKLAPLLAASPARGSPTCSARPAASHRRAPAGSACARQRARGCCRCAGACEP